MWANIRRNCRAFGCREEMLASVTVIQLVNARGLLGVG